ncbi:MAG TPA: cytochrome c [Acidobacteriaceae bacterium]|jgi:mono/diheme cytochrome c family protein
MQQRILIAVLAGLISATTSLAGAQQPTTTPKIKAVPIQPTSPASGEQMYKTYCAVCHGDKATGAGPAAPAMRIPPTDLTQLSQKNGGVFPADHVTTVLKFGVNNAAHGSSQMPVWGDLLGTLHSTGPETGTVVHQRIANLTNYLKQIQK